MVAIDFNIQRDRLLKEAKRNCLFCYGRARLRDTKAEKSIALSSAKRLAEMFEENYSQLRKTDAPTEYIQRMLENKRICLDAIDACNACDKTVDTLNRQMTRIK